MNILCKIKDYYDFVGYQNDSEDITFDRRNCIILVDKHSENCAINELLIYSFINSILQKVHQILETRVVGFWCGFILYLFIISAPKNRDWLHNKFFDYYVEYVGFRRCYEIKHDKVIDFVTIDTTIFDLKKYKLNSWKSWNNYEKLQNDKNFIIKDLMESNISNWKFTSELEDYPILKNTFVPKYISAENCYRNIEEWLIAQHNDIDQESKGITDVDKVINHGFDKKSSFRSVK